jgi:hypothetical protein
MKNLIASEQKYPVVNNNQFIEIRMTGKCSLRVIKFICWKMNGLIIYFNRIME